MTSFRFEASRQLSDFARTRRPIRFVRLFAVSGVAALALTGCTGGHKKATALSSVSPVASGSAPVAVSSAAVRQWFGAGHIGRTDGGEFSARAGLEHAARCDHRRDRSAGDEGWLPDQVAPRCDHQGRCAAGPGRRDADLHSEPGDVEDAVTRSPITLGSSRAPSTGSPSYR